MEFRLCSSLTLGRSDPAFGQIDISIITHTHTHTHTTLDRLTFLILHTVCLSVLCSLQFGFSFEQVQILFTPCAYLLDNCTTSTAVPITSIFMHCFLALLYEEASVKTLRCEVPRDSWSRSALPSRLPRNQAAAHIGLGPI